MNKILYRLAWLTILSAIYIVSLVSCWLLFPYKTTEFKNLPIKVENKTLAAGEDLVYYVEYCKYTDVFPEISKKFVDGIIYTVPSAVSSTKKGCGTNKIQIEVPKNLPAGVYHLNLNYRYKVNPLRTIDIIVVTEDFTVTK